MARKILFFVPDNPLAAFISTGVLARCLKEDESAVCHIYATPQTAEFFDDLPAKKSYICAPNTGVCAIGSKS